jgi:hypothetical protein
MLKDPFGSDDEDVENASFYEKEHLKSSRVFPEPRRKIITHIR